MGNECSQEEREFRYCTFHDALITIDNDIKKEMKNTNISTKKYIPYGLLSKNICTKYPFLINKNFDSQTSRKKIFDYKDLIKESEEKNFFHIDKRFGFTFPADFIFINKDFMDIIFDYVNDEIKKCLQNKPEFIIGGECLIKRNIINEDSNFFRYITLYNGLEEKEGNYTDFFLFIKDEKKRESAVNYILEYNLWNYFQKINYDYKDEYKKIIENGKEIGYIVRVSDLSIIESYISRKKQKEKKEINSSKNVIQISNENKKHNFDINPQNNAKINLNKSQNPNEEIIQNNMNNNNNINLNNFQVNIRNNNLNNSQNNNMNINLNNNINNNMNFNMNNNMNIPFNINNNNMNNNLQNVMNMMNNMNMNMNFNNMNNNINNMQNNMLNMNNMNNNQNLYERINYLTNENLFLKNTIQLKDNEIQELKLKIDNLINNSTQLVDFKKIRVVQFISMDHTIICGIKCLLTDTFAEVEEKLYKIYPQYRETNNAFQVDGRNILRFKTIAENNIQEGHGVQIIRIE